MRFSTCHSLLALATAALAIDTIEVYEKKFFYSTNGSQFYIKGVAYQQDTADADSDDTFVDPLTDEDSCKRDIPYLQELHTNVIRVYALNASASHEACMTAFADADIYVIADLSSPDESITTTDPTWTIDLYDRYTSVIDEMQQYDNVLGFFAGNEVITNNTNTDAAPFVKAAIRDMRTYMANSGYRAIPIGYSANDDSKTRVASADYFACGDDDVSTDFYGINMYEWCGSSTFKTSGYESRTEEFANLTCPAFFSEYGCNAVTPRKFTEVAALYSDEMTDVWSGGIVYMYFEETNDYGLVTIDGDTVSTEADFPYLKTELGSISPTTATLSAYSASADSSTMDCPATGGNWNAATDLPPTPEEKVCKCIETYASCVVSDDVDSDDYADLFSTVCGYIDCTEIDADGETGEYGGLSFCTSKQKLNYLLNKYYLSEDSASTACDFDGSATLNDSATASGTCSSIISSASASGGTVNTAAGASSSGSSGTDTADSTSTATSTSSGLAGHQTGAPVHFGPVKAYLVPAVIGLCVGSASILML